MTFPAIGSTNSSNSNNSASSPAVVNLPSGIASGDLLIIVISTSGTSSESAVTTPTGYTQLWSTYNVSTRFSGYYRWADGSEGSTQNFTLGANVFWATGAYRITGADTGTNPVSGTSAVAISSTPNPPSLNPAGWDVEDTLWLATCGVGGTSLGLSSYPTNYSLSQTTTKSEASNGALIAIAGRQLNAASEDPGTFSITQNRRWVAQTIAIRPAGAQSTPELYGLSGLRAIRQMQQHLAT